MRIVVNDGVIDVLFIIVFVFEIFISVSSFVVVLLLLNLDL